MVDWTEPMQQTFEYYIVNPATWRDETPITTVKKSDISRDAETDTLGSATFDITDQVGECYIRVYLVTIQNGVRERHPLGTFLVQTPTSSFDGKTRNVSMDGYTPLIELKENQPDVGYFVPKTVYHIVEFKEDVGYVETDMIRHNPIGVPLRDSNRKVVETDKGNTVYYIKASNTTGDYYAYYCRSKNDKKYYRVECVDYAGTVFRETKNAIMENFDPVGILLKDDRGLIVKTISGKPVYHVKYENGDVEYFSPDESVTDKVYRLLMDKIRAPIVRNNLDAVLDQDFVSDINDTWFSYLRDLLSTVNLSFDLDDMGRVIFTPYRDLASMQPVWTYTDDNSSILFPEVTMDHDIYGIPNIVEVRYYDGRHNHYCRVENRDPNSPTSTVNRGRAIVHRVTDLDVPGNLPAPPLAEEIVNDRADMYIQHKADNFIVEYAKQLLRELSTIEYTLTYTHGYCPVRLGDCVRLNYTRAGLTNIKAKVISQNIKCDPGCSVTEKAIFTTKLWG